MKITATMNYMEDIISASQIVADLVRIHEDRINTYNQILHESGNTEQDVKGIFQRIIEESRKYRDQLRDKIQEEQTTTGEIYKLWFHEKTTPDDSDKKTILATCAADELITNNTYSLALSLVTEEDTRALLEEHQKGLKKLHAHIRQFYNAQ